MNNNERKGTVYKAFAVFMLFVAFSLGFHICLWIDRTRTEHNEEFKECLSLAVSLAQEAFDAKYGKDAFLYGVRRIVRDGDKQFYGFFVADSGSKVDADVLVEVDLTCRPAKTIMHKMKSEGNDLPVLK